MSFAGALISIWAINDKLPAKAKNSGGQSSAKLVVAMGLVFTDLPIGVLRGAIPF
jgi:hypothetical protein